MAALRWAAGVLVLLVVSAMAEDKRFRPLSERIEEANRHIVRAPGGPFVEDDILYDSEDQRNADPCTSKYCKWNRSADGNVYVPYVIANHYTDRELAIIKRGLQSFDAVTCIRFVPRINQRDYIHIQSLDGCFSYMGRIGNAQDLSLKQRGCLYHDTVQHELLHALGFNHEQCRSDRDEYIRVLWENITPRWQYAFDKINTLNQGTPYDYNSVMQYSKYAFSDNKKPTMEPYPDPNVPFGAATEMSENDILRVNRLYNCN